MSVKAAFLSGCAMCVATLGFGQISPKIVEKLQNKKLPPLERRIHQQYVSDQIKAAPQNYFEEIPKWSSDKTMFQDFSFDVDTLGRSVVVAQSSAPLIEAVAETEFYALSREETYIDKNKNGIFEKNECAFKRVAYDVLRVTKKSRRQDVIPKQAAVLVQGDEFLITTFDKHFERTVLKFNDNCGDIAQSFETVSAAMHNQFMDNPFKAIQNTKHPKHLKPVQKCLEKYVALPLTLAQ